jgi:hypothetical protein
MVGVVTVGTPVYFVWRKLVKRHKKSSVLDEGVKQAVEESVAPLKQQISQTKQATKANIVFGQPFTDRRPTSENGRLKPYFCHIPIWNDPIERISEASAKVVWAKIGFYLGGELVLSIDSHNNCWGLRSWETHFMRMVDLDANGQEFLLDIAIKYEEDSCLYIPTFDGIGKGGREEKFKLDHPELNVEVRLQGKNMDDVSRKYVLRNFGKGNGIELTPR